MKAIRIIIFIIQFFLVSRGYTCSCDTEAFESAIESADEIFLGSITKAERYRNGYYIDSNEKQPNYNWKFHFEVKKKWKGNSCSEIIIYLSGTSCDYFFELNESEYLVYASKQFGKNIVGISSGPGDRENRLTAWLCSRTTSNEFWSYENWFNKDIAQLDKVFPNHIVLINPKIAWLWIGIAVVVVLISFYFLKRYF